MYLNIIHNYICNIIIIIQLVDGSLPSTFNLTITFESCTSLVFWSSLLDEGGCAIRYGQDLSYQDLGSPIQGPLDSSFPLPLMKATTTYYYQVTISSSLIIQLRGNFTTGVDVCGVCVRGHIGMCVWACRHECGHIGVCILVCVWACKCGCIHMWSICKGCDL